MKLSQFAQLAEALTRKYRNNPETVFNYWLSRARRADRYRAQFQLPFLAFLRRTLAEHIVKETKLLQKGASVNEQDYFVSMIECVSNIEVKCISFALKI